jgi:hypothetical protein
VRLAVWWIAVIVGGSAQYAYSETNHPSLALKIWARVSAAVVVILLVMIVSFALRALWRRRAHGSRHRG